MKITPDTIVYFKWKFLTINATILWTWVVMALLVLVSWLATRKLREDVEISSWQNAMETVVELINGQIRDVMQDRPERFLPLLGTLALFLMAANALTVFPIYEPPTGSLSTSAGLAAIVFAAVPVYGIREIGFANYLKNYVQPTPILLPFNVIGELSRTLALAVRLFGNIMSGRMIVGLLVALAPLFVPLAMRLLGLLTGLVQAFIFFILAAVYIGANMETRKHAGNKGASHG